MRVKNRTGIALIIILTLCILIPTVSARRKIQVKIRTVPLLPNPVVDDQSIEMPNGFTKVNICYKFFWYDYDGYYLGYVLQYITGITKTGSGNDFSSLHGYGVFTSEDADKIGTITYTIGNIHKPNDPLDPFDDEFWGGHLKVCEGTGYFEGLKGQGVLNFSEMLFELYLDYNPWG